MALYEDLRRYLGEVFRKLAMQKESRIEEGHLMPDHVHIDDCDSAEVCGATGYRVYQNQEKEDKRLGQRDLWR